MELAVFESILIALVGVLVIQFVCRGHVQQGTPQGKAKRSGQGRTAGRLVQPARRKGRRLNDRLVLPPARKRSQGGLAG
jgi:hypothetical protein